MFLAAANVIPANCYTTKFGNCFLQFEPAVSSSWSRIHKWRIRRECYTYDAEFWVARKLQSCRSTLCVKAAAAARRAIGWDALPSSADHQQNTQPDQSKNEIVFILPCATFVISHSTTLSPFVEAGLRRTPIIMKLQFMSKKRSQMS